MTARSPRRTSNPLFEFALTIVSTLGLGLPIALVVIWICA